MINFTSPNSFEATEVSRDLPTSQIRKSKSFDDLSEQGRRNKIGPAPSRRSGQGAIVAIPTSSQNLASSMQNLTLLPKKPLYKLLRKIYNIENLKKCNDLRTELSIEGKNVLHYVACEPDFSLHKTLIENLCTLPNIHQLLTHESVNEGETPLHLIVKNRNVAMLECILTTGGKDIQEYLRFAGSIITKSTGGTVFHYLDCAFDNKKINIIKNLFLGLDTAVPIPRSYSNKSTIHPQLLKMMDMLITLYGPLESKHLAIKADNNGCTLLTLSCIAGNYALIQKALEIFAPQDMRTSGKSPRAKRIDGEALRILLPSTQVTPLHILAAIGTPSCLQLLLTHYGAVAKEICNVSSNYFKANSALEMCSVTSCSTQDEKRDFVESCRLVLTHLTADFEAVDPVITHKLPDAQFVCRTLRTLRKPIEDPLTIDEYVTALYKSYQHEKQVDSSKA